MGVYSSWVNTYHHVPRYPRPKIWPEICVSKGRDIFDTGWRISFSHGHVDIFRRSSGAIDVLFPLVFADFLKAPRHLMTQSCRVISCYIRKKITTSQYYCWSTPRFSCEILAGNTKFTGSWLPFWWSVSWLSHEFGFFPWGLIHDIHEKLTAQVSLQIVMEFPGNCVVSSFNPDFVAQPGPGDNICTL